MWAQAKKRYYRAQCATKVIVESMTMTRGVVSDGPSNIHTAAVSRLKLNLCPVQLVGRIFYSDDQWLTGQNSARVYPLRDLYSEEMQLIEH